MDKTKFIQIIDEKKGFEKYLKNKLKSEFFSVCKEEYYLIEDSWIIDLNEKIAEYNNDENEDYDDYEDFNEFIPEDEPVFINNIESIINCVQKSKKLKLVSRKLIELIYKKNL